MKNISCCIIGKDEQNFIEDCLKSVVNKVSEIIYVDCGSTDDTIDIVKKYTDKIYILNHNLDNYSFCRNYSISKATKDYIFVIDCDEILQTDLINPNEYPEIDAWSVYQIQEAADIITMTFRLFRKDSTEYNGYGHETINIQGLKLGKTNIKILNRNRNLTSEDFSKKIERTIELVRKDDDELKKEYYEANYLIDKGDILNGIDKLMRIKDKCSRPIRAGIYLKAAELYFDLMKEYENLFCEMIQKSFEYAPVQNKGHLLLTDYFYIRNEYDKAINQLTQILNKEQITTDLQNDRIYHKEILNNYLNLIKEKQNGSNSN